MISPRSKPSGVAAGNGMPTSGGDLAVVLTGGGARAAYQVGVLRGIARLLPDARFQIITGVSAGAINAAFVASRSPRVSETIDELVALWSNLRVDEVFRVDLGSLLKHFFHWTLRLASGGMRVGEVRGLVDTKPLEALLRRVLPLRSGGEIDGIAENVARCDPKAVALTTLDYSTGQTVTWVQGCGIELWERPMRRSVNTRLSIAHVMASAALPLFFPAVSLRNSWHGDGGIRLAAPLSPALHLGAQRILAISTSHRKTPAEADQPTTFGYPPPAQIVGQLMNAVFLDVIDEDALRLERSNRFLEGLSEDERHGFRVVDLMVIRPSQDLGRLAGEYEPQLPRCFRFLSRGWGTRLTSRPDLLSLLMFEPNYLRRLIAVGEADAESRVDEIARIVKPITRQDRMITAGVARPLHPYPKASPATRDARIS